VQALRISRVRDVLESPAPRRAATDLSPLAGTWINFDERSTGIARVEIADRGGELAVHAWGTGSPAPCDWGEVVGEAFTDGVSLHAGVAFKAVYELGFARVTLACYLNKRLLVVDAYTVFDDGSGRSSYFQRDHFYVPQEP
jgi:hypothetical protein